MAGLTLGLPSCLPCSTARLSPALTRWRIMLRSNSANAPQTGSPIVPKLFDPLSMFGASCVRCSNQLIAPEKSEYLDDRLIRHIWHCPKCHARFEAFPRFPADAKFIKDVINKMDVSPPSITVEVGGAARRHSPPTHYAARLPFDFDVFICPLASANCSSSSPFRTAAI